MIENLTGDCRELLPTLRASSANCCVTSPPYWRQRSYLPANHPTKWKEIGSEPTVEQYVGQLVATRWYRTGLRPGDTLYFLSRRGLIHHTAIYVGNHEFIEAANAGVKITSFDPAAPNYDDKRDKSFCFAKRILD